MRGGVLIGREAEREWLEEAVAAALVGQGALVLLAGEAGVGKSRLADEVAAASEALALRGAASPAATLPYGPVLGALRGYLRSAPGALASCGPLQGHLALLLPELGPAVAASDRATRAARRAGRAPPPRCSSRCAARWRRSRPVRPR